MSRRILVSAFGFWLASAFGVFASEEPVSIGFASMKIAPELEEDAGLAAYLAPFREEVASLGRETLGYAAEALERRRPENGIANFTADALREAGEREFGGRIDFAVTNFGGLRRDLPAGAITRSLLMELSPFENFLTLVEIDGERALEIARATAKSGAIGISGMRVVASGSGELVEATIGGEPIADGGRYRVATIDYLFKTWDLFSGVPESQATISQTRQRDAMETRLRELTKQGLKVHNAGEGRVTVLP